MRIHYFIVSKQGSVQTSLLASNVAASKATKMSETFASMSTNATSSSLTPLILVDEELAAIRTDPIIVNVITDLRQVKKGPMRTIMVVAPFQNQCDHIGRFLLLGQAFKAGGIHYSTQIDHIVRQFLLKSIIFLVKSFLGNFYRHLAIFTGHTGCKSYANDF